jgi:outer membrane protein OmpA-like peptidoglycan-associated protein/tetratricopeptide (TPR) repeat protein
MSFTNTSLGKLYFALLFAFVFVPVSMQAQHSLADELFANFEFQKTIDVLSKVDLSDTDQKSWYQLAMSYYYVQDYAQAEKALKKLLAQEEPEILLAYAVSLKNNGKYEEAKKYLNTYAAHNKNAAERLIASCDSLMEWQNAEPAHEIQSIKKLNKSGADFSPAKMGDALIFASENSSKLAGGMQISEYSENVADLQYGYDIDPGVKYFYAGISDGQATGIRELKMASDENFRNNSIVYHPMQEKMYLTRIRIHENPDVKTRSAIYVANFNATTWGIDGFREVVFHDSLKKYNFGHPAFSADGQNMFFASDMPGGYGGYDLYVAEFNGQSWVNPRNLGAVVNSAGHEFFPSVSGDKLYYASDGFPGYGMLDVFCVEYHGKAWTKRQNLKAPINSAGDDFGLLYLQDHQGVFCSNRFGGKGDDDLYLFNDIVKEVIEIIDTPIVEEPVDSFDLIRDLHFGNILFGFDSYELDSFYMQQLDSLFVLLMERKENKIGLYGYTDTWGNSNYNLRLSNKRASAVYDYLLAKGLNGERVIFKAKGESKKKLHCETDSCRRAQNALKRRVEIVFNPQFQHEGLIQSSSIVFEEDQNELDADQRMSLKEYVLAMQNDEALKLCIHTYSDSSHSVRDAQYNIQFVQEYFLERKIEDSRLDTEVERIIGKNENVDFNSINIILIRKGN